MKKQGHPKYQKVLFVDSSSGKKFVCGTAATSDKTEKHNGEELPVIPVSISSASHPFFVGGKQFVDTEGRVDRFNKRYAMAKPVAKPQPEEPVKPVKATKPKKK